MAFSSNGQISYYVLESLANGSKYGLEIIEHISKKTNGGYIMKKPTLYSCLTRMEKKGLVSSSYWGESELGGKRHYYSITSEGRQSLAELEKQLPAEELTQVSQKTEETPLVVEEQTPTQTENEEKPTYLQQDNLFDLVKEEKPVTNNEDDEESDVLENQIDIFNMEPIAQPTLAEEEKKEEPVEENQEKMEYYQSILEQGTQDDGVLLSDDERAELTPDQEEQNRRLYDTSSELKKYRKKKSFSENQIEMAVVYDKEEDDEIQKARIAELKRSLLNMKNAETSPEEDEEEQEEYSQPAFVQYTPQQTPQVQVEETEEEHLDDGHLITERVSPSEIPVPHKIAPTNIEVNIYDDNLPAPKRNSDLEPTYKDIMSKLFERRTERQKQAVPQQTASEIRTTQNVDQPLVDYNSLKRYYQARNIEFKEYKKVSVRRTYNTNFLQFINSIILFVLAGLASGISFWIISAANHLNPSTNFMFYTMPILFVLYLLYALIKYRCFTSKKAAIRYNELTNWLIFLLSCVIIFIVNVACGMQFESIARFATSLLIPALTILIAFPVNFYSKKLLYKKYSR